MGIEDDNRSGGQGLKQHRFHSLPAIKCSEHVDDDDDDDEKSVVH